MEEGVRLRKYYLLSHIILALIVLSIAVCISVNAAGATEDFVLINSKDWRDVYSGMLYSKMTGSQSSFFVSQKHGIIFLQTLEKNKDYLLVESGQVYYAGFEGSMRAAGFNVERLQSANVNLELAKRIVEDKGIDDFLIVDDSYGYLAIAAASYAVVSDSYVLFADELNIDDLVDFLGSTTVDKVTIIGHVDRAVRDVLSGYDPETIDEGNRFATNIEIVKKYRGINPHTQIVITNGEFIEDEIMSGLEPVVFIGKDNIPDVTKTYITGSDIKVAVLVGNDLVRTATTIKRELGVTTYIKFARSARVPTGAMSKVEGLDLFYLPKYDLSITVASVRYNELNRNLEVTYRNSVEVGAYLKSTISVYDTTTNLTVGDTEPIFIEGGATKTITYLLDEQIASGAKAHFFVVYGESSGSLEKLLDITTEIEFTRILDNSQVKIASVHYDKKNSAFGVVVENTGGVDAFVSAEIVDVMIDEAKQTVGSKKGTVVPSGETKTVYVRQAMTDLDLADNPKVKAKAYYGQREDALFKLTSGEFILEIKGFDLIIPLVIAAVVLLIVIFLLLRKKKKKKKGYVHVHHVHNPLH